jgi:hypothetical protein
MIIKAKIKNKVYHQSKNQACQKCLGERVVFVENYKKYKNDIRDCGYWIPCTCIGTKKDSKVTI